MLPDNYIVEEGAAPAAEEPAPVETAPETEQAAPEPEAEPEAPAAPQGDGKRYVAQYDYAAADSDEVSFSEGDIIINVSPASEGWVNGTVEKTGASGMLPENYVVEEGAAPAETAAPAAEGGAQWKALYDYTAADGDEVSFAEGDIIINVEEVDDGWVKGTVQSSGASGMLPSNYIEQV
jgi:hypothetical protein